jgi:CheY-like chemotaxis protein
MIYLADDDQDDVELLETALRESSYKGLVNISPNGRALMQDLRSKKVASPDVILLDLNMPFKDGFEALKEIRQDKELQHIPVVVVTASARKDDEIKCFELGCNFYYNKPSHFDGYAPLVSLVKKLISDKRMA